MKKIYSLISGGCLLSVFTVNSQPTLTAANSNPIAGETFGYHSTNLASPAPVTNAGAGVTWNITAYSAPLNNSGTYVSASSTPYASTFPAANLAVDEGGGDYSYFLASSSEYSYYGGFSGGSITLFSDSWKQMSYPFSYNSTYNDNFYATTPPVAPVDFIYGSSTTVADGYGTIVMPYGTLTNVLRIHSTIDYTDSSASGVNYFQEHWYNWFLPGTHNPVCAYLTIPSFGFYEIEYLDQSSLGIENNNPGGSFFSISPNPAKDELFVSGFLFTGKEKTTITITNIMGQNVFSQIPETNNLKLETKINISNFPDGIYFVEVTDGKEKTVKKFVKE